MNGARPEKFLKPKLLAVSVAACFALNAGVLRANPTGPTVVSGGVGFSGLGSGALTITNQAGGNAVINWNGFSIGLNELTRFQQFANLAVLNRVTGSQLSSILGSLQSDGRVFLINPNGIVFGAASRIDVAGLVASSLNISDQDFLGNRLRFTEVPGAGAVVNNGIIETATGGRVYLVAPTVENNGLIQSPQGAIVLAAGKEVELVDAASPFVTVKVAAAEQAVNVGDLVAAGGQIGMFGALVRNSGVVAAGGAVAGPGGEIRLVATQDLTLDSGSVVSASGTSGGKVLLQAEGGTNLVGGTVEAKGNSGRGGEVSALGVRVGVVGHGVIDASGDGGGGTVRVGGDYQGKNAAIQNAERTYIGSDGVIRADAMTTGDGGRVVVWADGDTRFFGSISAKGGSQSGNGGFVETSAKGALEALGNVTTSAVNGQGGTWLLDPTNINVVANNAGPDDSLVAVYGFFGYFDGAALPSTSTIGVNSIDAGMGANGSVELQTMADINLQADVNLTSAGDLTFKAGKDINLGSHNVSIAGNLTMTAADPQAPVGYGGSAAGVIQAAAGFGNLTTKGGNVNLSGAAVTVGNINTSGPNGGQFGRGNVDVNATSGNISTGSITTRSLSPFYDWCGECITDNPGGYVELFASYGAISVNGGIDTRGANGVAGYIQGSWGGYVTLSAAGTVGVSGAINTSGGGGAQGENSAYGWGGWGGDGGWVDMSGGSISTAAITTRGGNGGGGGSFSDSGSVGSYSINVYGGGAGDGGRIDLSSSGAVTVNGTIDTSGAAGGNGGVGSITASGAGVSGYVNANGGRGGYAGWIDINGNAISTQAIVARGGAAGKGGSATVSLDGGGTYAQAYASGGYSGSGGEVDLQASASIGTGAIDTRGASGGSGGTASSTITNASGGVSAYANAYGGDGGEGGSIYLDVSSGPIIAGNVVSAGGSGGAGGSATASVSGPATTTNANAYANAGSGYYGGYVGMFAGNGPLTNGAIDTRSGVGGNGGTASVTVSGTTGSVNAYAEANGGSGGQDYYYQTGGIQLSGSTIQSGSLVTMGGNGGQGGNAAVSVGGAPTTAYTYAEATGGDGGSGYDVWLDANLGITAGQIDTRGGNGGGGGTTSVVVSGASGTVNAYSYANGGYGYYGGMVQLAANGPIVVGSIVTLGGSGANGGSASIGGSTPGTSPGGYASGGDGYYGGDVSVETSANVTTGGILTRGGNGGNAGVTSGSIYASYGGDGDYGGEVYVYGSVVKINLGGSLGATAIDSTGGIGGTGAAAASPAGSGGSGGAGGSVDVFGNPEITFFGVVNASGGAGGGGGAGNASNVGGSGGFGGDAGYMYIDAGASENIIFVLTPVFGVAGGAPGAGGANGGAGAGSPGSAGFGDITNFSHVGKIVVLDPLSQQEINQGYQQILEGSEGTTAFVGGEKEEEEEDKSQKELSSCKG